MSASSADSLARLRAMVADTTCTLPEHCQTVPVGAVACGGPQAYLPFSTLRVNAGEVLAQGERHKAARQAEIKAGGLMSSCRYLPDPGAVCTSGACQLGGSSAAAQ
ncbi:hypothetical protein [Massilia yuzhufengensis]|uniref:hypothetical protein n=1 Tax=Massilia yuzhufengensis TaxID=1164594 RepID=UPI001160782D|nr:hypothetical protein [Massilia yuzhufengensis]